MQPSHLYARPQAPSDIASENFHWGEDAASTIHPEDSVSQLDRRFTGKRRVLGPRAMDTSPAIDEEADDAYHVEALRDVYVPPEQIGRDSASHAAAGRDTVAPPAQSSMSSSRGSGAVRAVNPSMAGTGGPLARARCEPAPVPYTSPSMYNDDDEKLPTHEDDSRPLVAATGFANQHVRGDSVGDGGSSGSRIAPYSSKPRGYAALGGEHDGEEDYEGPERYAAYRSQPPGTGYPSASRAGPGSADEGSGSATLVGALSNPFGYFKRSLRGPASESSSRGRRQESFYAPNELAFDPPHDDDKGSAYPPTVPYTGASSHYPSASLDKVPSIDVVPPQDGYPSGTRSPYFDPHRSGSRGELIEPDSLWRRWFWDTTDPERRVWEHKTGRGIQRWPVASWTLALIMTIVLIVELVKMKAITGSVIQTKPSFNVMIGPSAEVLIHQGARFAGCMKYIPDVTNIAWTCPNATNSDVVSSSAVSCTMSDVCGFGGFNSQTDGAGGPNQSFRFFVPIFLHAGIVHLIFNMLAQCTSSAMVERAMGTPRFLVLYFASGIAGFVLGANFALVGQPSVGASGAIFGTQAALLVDLLAHWKIEYRPKRKLLMLIVEVIIGFGLGWVPGIDNFAHLGGFAMGLLVSLLLFPIIHPNRTHKLVFAGLRILVLPLSVVFYVVLVRNFYTSDPSTACSWCRYLSCWPTASNNHCKGTGLSTYSTSSTIFASLLTILFSTLFMPAA